MYHSYRKESLAFLGLVLLALVGAALLTPNIMMDRITDVLYIYGPVRFVFLQMAVQLASLCAVFVLSLTLSLLYLGLLFCYILPRGL